MPVEAEFAAAVTEARRGRGSVTLTAGGDERRWCAVIAAVDGALELRVGYPGRLARRRRSGALERLGWATAYDCWARPLPASTSESDAARELAAGLREGLHVPEDAELERVLVQTGGHALDLPDPGAPAKEHVAAVLRAVVRNGRGHAQICGGAPADTWAFVWAEDPHLVVELCAPGDPNDCRTWSEPFTPDGAELAARVLTEAARAARPGNEEPLFLALIE